MYAKGRTNTTFVHVQVEWASYTECLMPMETRCLRPHQFAPATLLLYIFLPCCRSMHYIYIFLKNIWSIEQTLFKSLRAPLQSTVSSLFCLLGVSLCMGNLLFFKPPPIRQISSIHQISRGLQSTDSHLPHLPSIWLSWTVQIRICTDLHGCVCTKLPKAIHLES